MKLFSILGGKAHVIELPEGATNPEVHTRSLTFDTPMEVDEWGYDYQSVKLPPGTWQIVGLLPEVTESEAATLVDHTGVTTPIRVHTLYMNYQNGGDHFTALESLESSIVAAGYSFSNPHGKSQMQHCSTASEPGDFAYLSREWQAAQSRVLSRERCLLLRRVDG